jgi:hypothetical protein
MMMDMNRKGVCYDVGRVLDGRNWRPVFDRREVRRELEIIRDDLHCNAVKIHAQDVSRLTWTAGQALELGLEAWLGPDLWDEDADATLAYVTSAAQAAEELRVRYPGRVYLSVGAELTLFMRGIVPGAALADRLSHPDLFAAITSEPGTVLLGDYLRRAASAVRQVFGGPITYAALPHERVDWQLFDFTCVDLYRDETNKTKYARAVEVLGSRGRPLIIGEFGCCTYTGADRLGGSGYDIIDHAVSPPRVLARYTRDEELQAREIAECLVIFDAGGVEGAFVQTFVQPLSVCNADPRFDFDMASYSLVKSYAGRIGELANELPDIPWDRRPAGTVYSDMPWDPKRSFSAVAEYYASH